MNMNARLPLIALLLLVAPLTAAPVPKAKLEGDAKLLQGTWEWDPAVEHPETKPLILLKRVVIKDDTLTFHDSLDGKTFETPAEFKLDPTSSPKTIDFTLTSERSANKGVTYLGLYEIKDDQLKICHRGAGSTRPKDFNDKQDGCDVTKFIVLKRAK